MVFPIVRRRVVALAMALNRQTVARNPGPGWGFGFLRWTDRLLPRPLFRLALAGGTSVAFLFMARQRRFAAEYRKALEGREPGLVDLWRQFFAFIEAFMELLRLSRGEAHHFRFTPGPEGEAFVRLARSERAALFGTFHVGNSDLLGYALTDFGRIIHMIRMKVGNSDDTRWLEERFRGAVRFLWVDRPEAMLFALKNAVEEGRSLAMKCDRPETSGRLEPFQFLGRTRLFPFALYHFSILFGLPAVLAVGWPAGPAETEITASTLFEPDPSQSRPENLRRAREHFQQVLRDLEEGLRARPETWFNFSPLNAEAQPPEPAGAACPR
jgi:predicted LPLAT superfamily acyltransferase